MNNALAVTKFKAYLSLTKTGIIRGNLMTAIAGFLFASKGHVNFNLLAYTLVSISLIIASGCVINNYTDRHIDSQMKRTKKRALITGEISSKCALVFGTILGLLGFGVLVSGLNSLVLLIGLIGYIVYVGLYAVSKRHTSFSTIIGSVSGSMALVAGYCAVAGRFDRGAWLLLLIMTFWQMPHFYSIAIYSLKDYKAAKLPVRSITSGINATKRSIIGYIIAFIVATVLLYAYGFTSKTYLVVMSASGLFWLWKGISGYHTKDSDKWAHQMFGYSLLSLLIFSLLISVNSFLVKI